MEKKKVILNNRTYEMTTKQARDLLKAIKESIPARTIYAVERDGIIQCVNEQYSGKADLVIQVREYTIKRYKVHYKA